MMKEDAMRRFNIPRILKLGDLDVRRIAKENNLLSANIYFGRVEMFIEKAPLLIENIINPLGSFIESLDNLKKLLTDIGYNKLDFEIDNLAQAAKNSNFQLISAFTSKISTDLNNLLQRLSSAYSDKFLNEGLDVILLREALEYLDYEEATRKLRILAVDDISAVLNMIVSVLSPEYEVFALTRGTQVERFLAQTTPELFLLDIEMPDMSGYDLIPVIRRFEEHKDTPIIFLTSNATEKHLVTAFSYGISDFIAKPVDREVLLDKIRNLIVRKKNF